MSPMDYPLSDNGLTGVDFWIRFALANGLPIIDACFANDLLSV